MSKEILKVTAYITRNREGRQQLLVFNEEGLIHNSGLQVPGGTVEEGEELLAALKREVMEEAGIQPFNIQLIGEHVYYSNTLKKKVKRYYYQMNADCPDEFTHLDQSQGEDNSWVYHYYWHDLIRVPTLYGTLGIHLDKIVV